VDRSVTTVYRAVLDGELQNIIDTGAYNLNQGANEVKGFYPTAGQSSNFARQQFLAWPGEGPYTLTSTSVPVSSLPELIPVANEGTHTFLRRFLPVQ
jgi:hypothetical protein